MVHSVLLIGCLINRVGGLESSYEAISSRSRVEWRWYSFRISRREQVDLFTAACLRTDRVFITRRSYHADTLPLLAVYKLRMI
jgi:hypothetical protein